MKTYKKEAVILADDEEYQMLYDARIHIRNTSASSINVLLKADECLDFGIIEEGLQANHMKSADVLLPKGIIKPSGGSCELLVWY